MAKGDRKLQANLDGYNVVACFRYIDDFLLCVPFTTSTSVIAEEIISVFKMSFPGV